MAENQELITKVAAYLETYMKKYDGSHDFHHLERVLGLSHTIYEKLKKNKISVLRTPTSSRSHDHNTLSTSPRCGG